MNHITISGKEMKQAHIFEKLKNGEISQKAASKALNLSTRWIREKLKRYTKHGSEGLTHRNRGKPSKRKWCEKEKALSLELLKSDFIGFAPTYASEKLKELNGIKISPETLRKVMIHTGLWEAKKRRSRHRKRRERKPCLGIMVQLDGSTHDWFEGRGPKCTLLVFIDDATSKLLWLEFVKSESTDGVMRATRNYIRRHGRPCSFYTDHGSVFKVNLNNKEHEKLSQFERAMQELDIEMIHAYSPQAKGRVERSNGTLQKRLIWDMRLAEISSMEDANRFVIEEYIDKHNAKFAKKALKLGNTHRPTTINKINSALCYRTVRILKNDYTILYKKRFFQLGKQQSTIIRPKDEITIEESLEGKMTLKIRKSVLNFVKLERHSVEPVREISQQHYKPAANHPWRRTYENIPTKIKNGGY